MTRVSFNCQGLDEYRKVAGKLEQGVKQAAEEVRLLQEKNSRMTASLFPSGAGSRLDEYADAAGAEADRLLKLSAEYQEISRKASDFLTRYLDVLSAMDTPVSDISSAFRTGEAECAGGMEGAGEIRDISDLTPDQSRAIYLYTGDKYYGNINNSLRGLDTMTSESRIIAEHMRSALKSASLPEDMILYRGTSTNELGAWKGLLPGELIGKTFIQPGFMSTSRNETVAKNTFMKDMEIIIVAPKGAHALDIAGNSIYGINESEVLFDAGQEMLITRAMWKDGILYITVLLEGR
ncbi:ADP-ribosyltransferase [Enterocloster bolteae]|uniref:ADP-ribosyltransferase n=1 Tax=Enterocloster bolteae TaxID=208479 RepID=UPI00210CAB08|nr:ADP-ribosyltransferase [Enterocloster bolteae]MCQ5140960.1 ADP-ribosyltransferase [Enterocloster bolteae]